MASAASGVLVSSDAAGAWAWIAVNIEPKPDSASGYGSDAERRTDAAMADAAWLTGQWDPAPGTSIELRYLHDPGLGGIRCALLGRVFAHSAATAITAALRLRDRLCALPAHVSASPVRSEADVYALLSPFPQRPAELVEVRKQIRVATPSRPDAGVAYYLAVTPFEAGAASWEPLWQRIAALPQPVVVTIGLEPHPVAPQFRDMLADLAGRYRRLATPGHTQGGPLRGGQRAVAPDPFATYAADLYAKAQIRYQSTVFRTRITIASPNRLPPSVVEHIAATICAGRSDAATATHVVVSPTPDEADIAWRNVTVLDHTRWDHAYLGQVPVTVPTGLRLLAELCDPAEAAAGWRFPPAPGHGNRPVFISVTAATLVVDQLGVANVQGDSFSNIGAGATIINRSTLTNSLNAARQVAGEDTAKALQSVSQIVENSGNADAVESLNEFNEELAKPDPKKSRLKLFWKGVTDSLGPLSEVATFTEHIVKLFS